MRSPMHRTVWRAMAFDKASKSSMGSRELLRSAETIGPVEEAFDVSAHRVFERREAAIVAGAAETIDLSLREVLITSTNLLGHVDIFDVRRRAERRIGRQHQILEAARPSGSDIEQAADRPRREQPHHHPHDVVDIDEIAPLIAVADTVAVRLEQLHDAV